MGLFWFFNSKESAWNVGDLQETWVRSMSQEHPFEEEMAIYSSIVTCKSPELCPTFCDPKDCSPPGFSVHRIFQAGLLDQVPLPSPGDLPDPGIEPVSPALASGFFTSEPLGKPQCVSRIVQCDIWGQVIKVLEASPFTISGQSQLPHSEDTQVACGQPKREELRCPTNPQHHLPGMWGAPLEAGPRAPV